MSTFNALVAIIQREVRDPVAKTFTAEMIGDFINAGLAEIGRIAPNRFQQDITPIADTLTYTVSTGVPEIEVKRVELWDSTRSPMRFVRYLRPAATEYARSSPTGWAVWDGTLELTNDQEEFIDPAVHVIRVWGYGPYPEVAGSTAMPVSNELEKAIIVYARLEALRSLAASRNLYSQWQVASSNSDISIAQLATQISSAEDQWRRHSRAITRLRETF